MTTYANYGRNVPLKGYAGGSSPILPPGEPQTTKASIFARYPLIKWIVGAVALVSVVLAVVFIIRKKKTGENDPASRSNIKSKLGAAEGKDDHQQQMLLQQQQQMLQQQQQQIMMQQQQLRQQQSLAASSSSSQAAKQVDATMDDAFNPSSANKDISKELEDSVRRNLVSNPARSMVRAERIDNSRNDYRSSGDSDVYLNALLKSKATDSSSQGLPMGGSETMAEKALKIQKDAEKLWNVKRQQIAAGSVNESNEIVPVDPFENDPSMSSSTAPYEKNALSVASMTTGSLKGPQTNNEDSLKEVELPMRGGEAVPMGPRKPSVIQQQEQPPQQQQQPEQQPQQQQQQQQIFVYEATDEMMEPVMQGKKNAIVMFYTQNCKFCHEMMPEYMQAAYAYNMHHASQDNADPKKMVWLRVDAVKNGPKWAKAMNIKGAPALFRFAGEKGVAEYPQSPKDLDEAHKPHWRMAKSLFAFSEFSF